MRDFFDVGLTGDEIYNQVTGGPGTGSLDAARAALEQEAALEGERAHEIRRLADEIGAGWQGAAADGAVGVAGPMADTVRARVNLMITAKWLLEEQSEMFNHTKNSVVPVPVEPPKGNFLNNLTPWETELDRQIKQYQNDVQHNFDVYDQYDMSSLDNEQRLPRDFPSSTEWSGNVSATDTGASPGGGPNPGGGPGPGGGGPNPGGSGPNPGSRPDTASGPSSVSGPPQPAGVSGPPQGTDPEGVTPPPNQVPPGTRVPVGGPLPVGNQPPSGGLPPVGSAPAGGRGLGFGADGGGRAGGPGVRGGGGTAEGGPGGRGGPGARGGAFGEHGPGGRPGAGELAGEEAAARRGGAAAGSRGAGGAGGYGPMGAGRGPGGEDEEHDRKYTIEPDPEELFGTNEMTAPPVIGEEDED